MSVQLDHLVESLNALEVVDGVRDSGFVLGYPPRWAARALPSGVIVSGPVGNFSVGQPGPFTAHTWPLTTDQPVVRAYARAVEKLVNNALPALRAEFAETQDGKTNPT